MDKRISTASVWLVTVALLAAVLASPSSVSPVVAQDGITITDLGTLGGNRSEATGINDLGQVVGHSAPEVGYAHAFLWENGTWTDLGTFYAESEARDINDLGQAVGWSETADGSVRATLWTVPLPQVDPDEAIAAIGEDVEALVIAGSLSDGEANALTAKLDAAQRQWDRGNTTAAANVLEAFINQVEAMVGSGRLTADDAQLLIDAAYDAIALIEA